jgi:hypothetical protein
MTANFHTILCFGEKSLIGREEEEEEKYTSTAQ